MQYIKFVLIKFKRMSTLINEKKKILRNIQLN